MTTDDVFRLIPDHRVLLRIGEEIFQRNLRERDHESPGDIKDLIPDCRTLEIPIQPVANPNLRWIEDLIPYYKNMIHRDVVGEPEYTPTLEELEEYLDLRKQG